MGSEDAQGSSEGAQGSELKKGSQPAGALTIFRQLGEEEEEEEELAGDLWLNDRLEECCQLWFPSREKGPRKHLKTPDF